MPERTGRRPGRRPGANQTRQAILSAARAEFAEHGFGGATVRAIARSADVDPALVLHFFGSKRVLFTAATSWPFETSEALERIVTGPRSRLGHRMVAFMLSVWEDPERREPMLGMLRAATTDPQAAELVKDSFMTLVLGPVGETLDKPDAELRMTFCSSQLIGLGIARYILHMEPLASLDAEQTVEIVGPSLQRYMTGKLGPSM
jgi:AcrR family transcriptional regulator